ncbi:MAG TPA: hypothetical protein VFG98_10145, partial [Intrasporangium sp.]|nr:hypothetical protein [Intrasporangium sp.]
YHRIKPTLLGLLPHRWSDPENRALKPWARAVITVWVLITIPMMALMLLALVTAVPRLLATAWAVVEEDAAGVMDSWGDGGLIDVVAHGLQVLGVVLPLIACAMILWRVGLRWFRGLAGWSRGSVLKRVAAAALSAIVITTLFWAWSQPSAYRPIVPGERGLFTSLLPAAQSSPARVTPASALDAATVADPAALPVGAAAERRLASGAPLEATFEEGAALPTKSDPQLAIVLVPTEDPGGGQQPATDDGAEPWVFPFDKPLPPEEGDNQAGAYNTTDGSMKYDIAFALVWAEGNEVLNVNEAHAYASCSNCVTVAVAFQVVLIMDDAQVVVPQNLAVAANYECFRCITAALASQLVLSVEETPGEEQLFSLVGVWNRLTEFGQNITSYSLAEISTQLEAFKEEIVAILGGAPPVVPATTSTASPTESQAPASSEPSSDGSSTSSSTTPPPSEPASEPAPSEPATTEPSPEPTTEPTTAPPSPEPTTESPTPESSPTP